jgi:uncharacterized coiled-coil protein SlyX
VKSERYWIARDRFSTKTARGVLAVMAIWLCAVPVQSAQVRDVRVGEHPEFTRIVFELDSETAYTIRGIEADPVTNELRVDLEADSFRRVLTSRSELVESVRVEPGLEGSVARIQLRGAPVTIADMVLREPHRIVLDVHRAQQEAPPPVAETEPVAPVAEVQVELEPGQDPWDALESPVTHGDDVALEMMPEPEPEPEVEEVAEEEASELAAEPDVSSKGETAASEAAADVDDEAWWAETEAGEEAAVAASPSASTGRPKRQAADDAPEEEPADATLSDARAQAESQPADGGVGGVFGMLTSPMVLAVLLLIGAIVVFFLMRPRRRDHPEPLPDFDPGPEPIVEATAEDGMREMAMPVAEEADTEAETFEAAGSIFDAPEPEPVHSEPEIFEPPPEPPLREPVAAAPSVDAEEFERRIGELEKRVAEILDVKERLERQLAAQTEELRVQRAAIARTQRVLRTLTRPEDVATEPTPRN